MNFSAGDGATASPGLVPELLITDLRISLDFWVGLCGFTVFYDRPQERFAYLTLGAAHVMLEQIGVDRNWIPDVLQRPLGRGVNFEITVPSIAPLVERLGSADWPLFMAPEYKTYFTGETAVSVAQFLVQDPDGYLLRFASPPT
jgi:catechol 2,3-dioxygenase-like lactoylglutathione lyase family enzyme